MMTLQEYTNEAVSLLKRLIAIPSVSRDEKLAADELEKTIRDYGFEPHREGNNVWVVCPDFQTDRPTILLNAHIDAVRPVASWTRDPHTPVIEGDRLYGLGANDCGGGLVSLLQVFRILTSQPSTLYHHPTPINPSILGKADTSTLNLQPSTLFTSPPAKKKFLARTASSKHFPCCPKSMWPSLANRRVCSLL